MFPKFQTSYQVAQEKGVDPEYIEKRLKRRLFLDENYNNFGVGPFLPFLKKITKI